MDIRDTAIRTAWTALQAFLGVILPTATGVLDVSEPALKAGVVSAVAAAIVVVKQFVAAQLAGAPEA
ncbi:MAG: hypothetical protein ACKVWR_00200 [Acidimicrobiales bacterium]